MSSHESTNPHNNKARSPTIEKATVVGLNGVGRQVAIQLASLDIPRLLLVDGGVVSRRSHLTEGHEHEEIGHRKIHAVSHACHQLNPSLDISTCRRLPRGDANLGDAVFLCTQSQECQERRAIGSPGSRVFLARCRFSGSAICLDFAEDGQLDGVSAACEEPDPSPKLIERVPAHVAAVVAGLMLGELVRFTSGRSPARQIRFDPTLPRLDVDM